MGWIGPHGQASIVSSLSFIIFGNVLMEVFKFSARALYLAGGLILLIYAIKTTLKEPKYGDEKGYATDRQAEKMAVYPLAISLMASPMGLVMLQIPFSNNSHRLENGK